MVYGNYHERQKGNARNEVSDAPSRSCVLALRLHLTKQPVNRKCGDVSVSRQSATAGRQRLGFHRNYWLQPPHQTHRPEQLRSHRNEQPGRARPRSGDARVHAGKLEIHHNPRNGRPYFSTSLFSIAPQGSLGTSPRSFFSWHGQLEQAAA